MNTITSDALLQGRRRIISRGLLARLDRVEAQGGAFAVKRFEARTRSAWATEVASHLICPQPEVVALIAYGVDDCGRPWLATPWVDKLQARHWMRNGHPELQKATKAWINHFQGRLSQCGYRWCDAASRNLLIGAEQLTNPQPVFQVVDYVLSPLKNDIKFAKCLNNVETTRAAEAVMRC